MFTEVNSVRASTAKVVCCHFSSDGKLLATGGHDMKVIIVTKVIQSFISYCWKLILTIRYINFNMLILLCRLYYGMLIR